MIDKTRIERVLPWCVAIGLLLSWEAACRVFAIPAFILPPPSHIAQSIHEFFYPLMTAALQTLITTVAGFLLAVLGGIFLGIAVGASRLIYSGVYPLLIAFNSVPKVAIVPILAVWFGIGVVPAVITAFLISLFPIAVNVAIGLATIEPDVRDVCRSLGATKMEIVTKVGIPRAMPYLFGSLKVAIALAFVGSVLSESVAGKGGIGYLMVVASARFEMPLVFAGLIVIAAMAITMYSLCSSIERRMTHWAFRGHIAT
jgi:NitT/TauT family transport system permease protein